MIALPTDLARAVLAAPEPGPWFGTCVPILFEDLNDTERELELMNDDFAKLRKYFTRTRT